jgi:hypothetical protein
MMTVTYVWTVTARCPVDDTHDRYLFTLQTDRIEPVERLLAMSAKFAERRIFQEALTHDLAQLVGHGTLTSSGDHSGVRVVVKVGP